MPNKKDYPKGFRVNWEPKFHLVEPKESYDQEVHVDSHDIYSGNVVEKSLIGFTLYKVYDDLVTFRKYDLVKVPNKNYKKELEIYNKAKEEFNIELKEWKILAARWKEEEKQETEAREKALFEKLSVKYGKK